MLVRSRQSGLLMLNPRPEPGEMERHYHEGSYDPHLGAESAASVRDRLYLAARGMLLKRKASLVLSGEKKITEACRILEVGCSTGDLLHCLHRKKGIPLAHLAGIENDAAAAAAAEQATGIRIHRTGPGGLDRAILFDRIVFWHVFEHLHDLHGTLEEAAARLERQGVMVMALPNPESCDARHYGKNWVAWDAPRHLWHFTPETLGALLGLHGLEIFRTAPYLPDTFYTCWYSARLSALTEGRRFNPASIAGALLQAALCTAAARLNRSNASTLVYYIRKRC